MNYAVLSFTDTQLAEVLRYARMVPDDADHNCYFANVADVLRRQNVDDPPVHAAVDAAFAPYAVRIFLGGDT
jgi:hypothetical protein